MRRLGLFALLGLFVLATSTASATSLKVDAGVLQAWMFDVDLVDCEENPEAPHCDEEDSLTITFEVRHYAGQSGKLDSTETFGPYLVPAGQAYNVAWSGEPRPCPTEPPSPTGVGRFPTSDVDLLHTLCVQKSQPGALTVTLDDGTEIEPSVDGPWGISSTSATLCEGFEDASFCTGPSDQ